MTATTQTIRSHAQAQVDDRAHGQRVFIWVNMVFLIGTLGLGVLQLASL